VKQLRILWIDDQEDVARTIAGAPLLHPFEFSFSRSAEEGLQAIRDGAYDLVLADLSMPPGRWGGIWLLEQLKAGAVSHPPVIVVSGEGGQLETIKALRLGASDYVIKEHAAEELVSRIQNSLAAASGSHGQGEELLRLIDSGESGRLEFKSTLRFNLKANKIDPVIELQVIKSIAAFLNSDGGVLLVGVGDDGSILGLDADRFQDLDALQLHFWNRIRSAIGAEFVEFIHATARECRQRSVLQVDCSRSPRPVFVSWKESANSKAEEHFYVRAGPQTEELSPSQIVAYSRDHFR
jgi:DNA-binding response OmpR family regulator